MTLGEQLQADFIPKAKEAVQAAEENAAKGYKGKADREVALFRALRNSMNAMSSYPAAVSELHGKPRQVAFHCPDLAACCELGDLGIVAFSSKAREIRVVIVQNKFKKGNQYPEKIAISRPQYVLLSRRPVFQFVSGVGAKKQNDMLRESVQDSVCVYGNFYETGAKKNPDYDMSCITASKLTPLNAKCSAVKLINCENEWQSATSFSTKDFVAASNLRDFGDLLGALRIGRGNMNAEQRKRMLEELRVAFEDEYVTTHGKGDDVSKSRKDILKCYVERYARKRILAAKRSGRKTFLHYSLLRDAVSFFDDLEARFSFLELIPRWNSLKDGFLNPTEFSHDEPRFDKIERLYDRFRHEPEHILRYERILHYELEDILEDILKDMDDSSCGEYLALYERQRGVWERFSSLCGDDGGRSGGGDGGSGGGDDGDSGSGGGDDGDGYGRALLEGCRSVILLDVSNAEPLFIE